MNSITLQSVRGSFSAVSTPISAIKSWNVIDEIYKIYIFLHRSDHKNSANLSKCYIFMIFQKIIFVSECCLFCAQF
jgi:hypothetical protein